MSAPGITQFHSRNADALQLLDNRKNSQLQHVLRGSQRPAPVRPYSCPSTRT